VDLGVALFTAALIACTAYAAGRMSEKRQTIKEFRYAQAFRAGIRHGYRDGWKDREAPPTSLQRDRSEFYGSTVVGQHRVDIPPGPMVPHMRRSNGTGHYAGRATVLIDAAPAPPITSGDTGEIT